MFKALRDRLRGVSKQLEDEIESQLGDRLEEELRQSMGTQQGQVPMEPPSEEATEADALPGPESGPGVAPEADHAPVRSYADTPEDMPDEARPVETKGERPPQGEPLRDAPPVAKPPAAPPTEPAPDRPDRARPSDHPVPQEPSQVQAPDKTRPAVTGQAPGSQGSSSGAPRPAVTGQAPGSQGSPSGAPRPAVTGRKMFTEDEIEARLRRELESAVSTQKAVEEAAAPASGARFTINEEVLEDILWELEIALIESDVAVPVIEAIKESVKEQLLTLSVRGRPEDVVEKVLRTAIRRVLDVEGMDFDGWLKRTLEKKKPVVIMFVGVNGTGKTTTIARMAHRLKQQGISCVMAAGDTFRAGAIEQLSLHGERLGIKVVKHSAGADPAAVAYDAIEHARARHKEVVLLDTAGRMQNNVGLMDEMDKIRRVAEPDLCIFVGDSLAGNDAVEQARKFDEVVDVGGAVLTKVDVDAKGGAALSVAYTINKPLLFVGVGQDYGDLRPFDAGWMVERLFGTEDSQENLAAT